MSSYNHKEERAMSAVCGITEEMDLRALLSEDLEKLWGEAMRHQYIGYTEYLASLTAVPDDPATKQHYRLYLEMKSRGLL